ALAHGRDFLAHERKPFVPAAEREDRLAGGTLWIEEHRALPAAARAEARALGLQAVIERRSPARPACGPLLPGESRGVLVLIDLDRLRRRVGLVGVGRVAAAVEGPEVPFGPTVDDPLRERLPRATGLHDAEAEGVAVEEIAEPMLGPDIGIAVGRIG